MNIKLERFVSRNMAKFLSNELDMSGVKLSVNTLISIMFFGGILTFAGVFLILLFILHFSALLILIGSSISGFFLFMIIVYMVLEYKIDKRKTFLEELLPDYLQIVSANLRSGISLDRAMLLSLRPEFQYFNEDIKELSRKIYAGESFENGLREVSNNYRSNQLKQSVRMIIESLKYGGATADLLDQISKDLRNQQMVQKEVSGQLFMYSLFVAFAGLIAAPALFGLTGEMITVVSKIWVGILQSNPAGFSSVGLSLLKPSPPKITPLQYHNFSLAAIITITGFASVIMSAISSGSIVRGIKYTPLFILIGVGIFLIVGHVIAGMFTGIGGI